MFNFKDREYMNLHKESSDRLLTCQNNRSPSKECDIRQQSIITRFRNRYQMICFKDIIVAKAEGQITRIFSDDGHKVIIVARNIGSVYKIITKDYREVFLRCHKSYIINLMHVHFLCSNERLVNVAGLFVPISERKFQESIIRILEYGVTDQAPPNDYRII